MRTRYISRRQLRRITLAWRVALPVGLVAGHVDRLPARRDAHKCAGNGVIPWGTVLFCNSGAMLDGSDLHEPRRAFQTLAG